MPENWFGSEAVERASGWARGWAYKGYEEVLLYQECEVIARQVGSRTHERFVDPKNNRL